MTIRRTAEAPTKSGVLGMICCAMGIPRTEAREELARLNSLAMGVRSDRAGALQSDYHTVGAGTGMLTAQGDLKTGAKGTLITRRYYLCDASFLVALQGDVAILEEVAHALCQPKWPVFLGRKSCPPTVPVINDVDGKEAEYHDDLRSALGSREWRPRVCGVDSAPAELQCIIEWRPSAAQRAAPATAETWDDLPISFDPPVHGPRLVLRESIAREEIQMAGALWKSTPAPPRPRADYSDHDYLQRRKEALARDGYLCVFCKSPVQGRGATVQHITYRRAGGMENIGDLRTLCRLCHDAVTMIEYGLGMGLDRVNPEDLQWREEIIRKRDEIIRFRSLATRRRHLDPEED
jgi:CRISPR system Cascade subunit CasD